MTPSDFDRWRAEYAEMPEKDRRAFDTRAYAEYPEQAHGHLEWILKAIATVGPRCVVEVGGWRGDHAAAVLGNTLGISTWLNIEYCREAVANPKCTDPRYAVRNPAAFRWWIQGPLPSGDLLILSHVIEHLSAEDLSGLLEAASVLPAIYVEAPLTADGEEWAGYLGTHILPWGWRRVDEEFARLGYTVARRFESARLYVR